MSIIAQMFRLISQVPCLVKQKVISLGIGEKTPMLSDPIAALVIYRPPAPETIQPLTFESF